MPRVRNFTGVSKGERQFYNYDFTSVLTGKSYVTYYALENYTISGANLQKLLHPTVIATQDATSGWTTAATGGGISNTYEFDAVVEKTNTIEGTSILKAKWLITLNSGTMIFKASVTLQRVRDGVVTNIADEWFREVTGTTGATDHIKITARKTRLIKGDVLRLSFTFSVRGGPGNTTFLLYHDPEGATDEDLNITIPFIPDI